jgi:hypothetical protein
MKGKVTKTLFPWFLILTLTLASGVITPRPAFALSVYDYFAINYDTEFSKNVIGGGDVFYATVLGTADCKQDMPLTVAKGYITSRVVAQHRESGHKVTLNPSYTIDIEPFPNEQGETTEAQVVIPLAFPSGSPAGTYDIAGELIEAKVKSTLGFWLSVTPYLPAVEELGSVSYQPQNEDFTITGSLFDLAIYLDNGISLGDHVFQSEDGECRLAISDGTLCLTSHGEPLPELTMTQMAEPLAPPPGYLGVGLTYHLGPTGATFDPSLELTLTYDAAMVPAGVAESELVMAIWDEVNAEWVILAGSTINPGTDTITVALSHFSAFTILAPAPVLKPANFTVTNLTIAPEQAKPGEEITISVLVTNTGDLEGICPVILKVDGTVAATSDITLTGDSRQMIIFTTQKDAPGTYNIDVNGLPGTFTIEGATPGSLSWWLIGGIIAAVAAAITIPLVLRRRRRGF